MTFPDSLSLNAGTDTGTAFGSLLFLKQLSHLYSPLLEAHRKMDSTQGAEPLLVNGASLHVVNGVNGERPASPPSVGNLALTEYSAQPSPPSEDATTSKMKDIVPDEFLLPNGHVDVSSASGDSSCFILIFRQRVWLMAHSAG